MWAGGVWARRRRYATDGLKGAVQAWEKSSRELQLTLEKLLNIFYFRD